MPRLRSPRRLVAAASEVLTEDQSTIMKRLLNELLFGLGMMLSAGAVLVLIWLGLIALFSL